MFQLHQIIETKVVDILDNAEFILSYKGHLFRVSDKTGQIVSINQKVNLLVTAVKPLKFRVTDSLKAREKGKLNLSV